MTGPSARPAPPRRPVTTQEYLRGFRSDVFWWEPDGRVAKISAGDGVYLMACMHPDGQGAVFWGGASGRPRLWAADGAGHLEALTPAGVSARYPAFDLQGRHLVYSVSDDEQDTIEEIGRGPTSARPAPGTTRTIVVRRTADSSEWTLTDGSARDERPALSPDGTQVVFVSDRGGQQGLWRVPVSGGEPEPLLLGGRPYRPWWSVDGHRIYFVVLGRLRDRIQTIPAGGGQPVPLAGDDRGRTHGPFADPDGRHLLAHSTRGAALRSPTARWALFAFPIDGGAPTRLRPPGHPRGAHVTRARNGVATFDVSRPA